MKKILIAVFAAFALAAWVVPAMAADVKLGGELMERGVFVENEKQTTIAQTKDLGYIEQRLRLNVNAELEDNVKVFVSVQDSRIWGEEASTATTGNEGQALDLSQGYVEFSKILDQPIYIRVGRQAMAYGEHRLIGSFEWSNNARRFDAIKLGYNHEVFNVDLWTAKVKETSTTTSGAGQRDQDFNGIYATVKVIPMNTLDLYYLQDRDGAIAIKRDVRTMGIRLNGGAVGVDWTAEYAKQGGRSSKSATEVETKQDSNAYAIKAGYTIPEAMSLRIGAEYDAATGDKDATDTKNQAFQNLYPTNHPLYGYTDDITWTDMKSWSINARVKPMDKLKVSVEYWAYKADEVATVLGQKQSDDLGTETNIKANYDITKSTSLEAAYVLRAAGDAGDGGRPKDYAARAIPKDEKATFAYLMLNVKF